MASEAFISCELAKMRPISSLPVAVYRKEDGVRVDVDHPLNSLLQKRWNPFMTSMQGLRWMILRRDTFGNAFVRVQWVENRPVALWPINTDVKILHEGLQPVYEVSNGDEFTPAGKYHDYEILNFKSAMTLDGFHGCSIVEMAASSVGLSIDLSAYYSNVLENGSHYGGYLETDDDLSHEEKMELATSLKGGSGILEAGKVRIFDKGLKYKQAQQSMAELNIIEQQRWILQRICGVTSVPPQEVFDLSNNTYSNAEQGAINFVQKTIVPDVTDIEQIFKAVLENSGFGDCYVKFNVSGLLRGDFETQQRGYQIGVYTGYYTRADVRNWEDLPPIQGLERPMIAVNYATIDENGRTVVAGADAAATALNSIKRDAFARIAARVEKQGDCEGVRKFAVDALLPIANASILAGIGFDIESEVERAINEVL